MTNQEAINELEKLVDGVDLLVYTNKKMYALNMAINALKAQKTSKWVKQAPYPLMVSEFACDNCWHGTNERTRYCPECGARMEVEE